MIGVQRGRDPDFGEVGLQFVGEVGTRSGVVYSVCVRACVGRQASRCRTRSPREIIDSPFSVVAPLTGVAVAVVCNGERMPVRTRHQLITAIFHPIRNVR